MIHQFKLSEKLKCFRLNWCKRVITVLYRNRTNNFHSQIERLCHLYNNYELKHLFTRLNSKLWSHVRSVAQCKDIFFSNFSTLPESSHSVSNDPFSTFSNCWDAVFDLNKQQNFYLFKKVINCTRLFQNQTHKTTSNTKKDKTTNNIIQDII